jgi:RNA polymerase sigma-70 factor (ECF subfamily)
MNQGHTTQLQQHLLDFTEGDESVRDQIIEHTCERLRLRTRQMLKSFPAVSRWSQTDDVLQNAMVRLHRSLAQVKPESPCQYYGLAAKQIRRELLDMARKFNGAMGVGKNHESDFNKAVPRHQSQDLKPENLEAWARFHEAIEKLNDDQKQVVELLWYEGISQPQAAKVIGVSLATVKRRWQSSRLFLSEQLDEVWFD